MDEWLKILASSGINVVIMGSIAWAIRYWVETINKKLDELLKTVHAIELKDATQSGSVNTRFALVETKVQDMAERIAKQESSTKRMWSIVDGNVKGRGSNE